MFRAEVRNIILSSMAHQSLIYGSSNANRSLINRSSNAHQTLIFFRILYALPKSPRVILRALCGYASYCTSAYVFCAVYLTAGTFWPDITEPPASSLDSAPADGGKARIASEQVGCAAAAGPAIGAGGHCATPATSCQPAARKASCRLTGACERKGSTERNICGALHHLAIAVSDATTSRRGASFWRSAG
jgi:hypothetical protein